VSSRCDRTPTRKNLALSTDLRCTTEQSLVRAAIDRSRNNRSTTFSRSLKLIPALLRYRESCASQCGYCMSTAQRYLSAAQRCVDHRRKFVCATVDRLCHRTRLWRQRAILHSAARSGDSANLSVAHNNSMSMIIMTFVCRKKNVNLNSNERAIPVIVNSNC